MKPTMNDPWEKLVALARQAPADDLAAMGVPYGFATRVTARAFASDRRQMASLFEPMALRALGVASFLALIACLVNLDPVVQAVHDEITASERDPATAVLDL